MLVYWAPPVEGGGLFSFVRVWWSRCCLKDVLHSAHFVKLCGDGKSSDPCAYTS